MATNQYGLDVSYFKNCIERDFLQSGIGNYTPDEFARICLRMAVTADAKVLLEPEFAKVYDMAAPVCTVKHGPLDSSGWPEFVKVETIGDFDLENIPDGTKLYMRK